jgi:hypothetical protein
MKKIKITTFSPEKKYSGHIFYILNKGNNSGKPMDHPCPNCFVCECETEEEKEQLYWLIFGLWQGKTFHQKLLGSVIPYIRLNCLKEVIQLGIKKYQANTEKAKKNISTIHQIENQRQTILKQFHLMQQLKLVLIKEILK